MKKLFLLLLTLSFGTMVVNADRDTCSEQLAKAKADAANVKVSHEIEEEKIMTKGYDESTHTYTGEMIETTVKRIRIDVFNITSNIFVVQRERLNYEDGLITDVGDQEDVNYDEFGKQKIITFKDTNEGKYSLKTDELMNYKDYKFIVYPDIDENCEVEVLKTINYRKPRYNTYSENEICKEYPTVELCKEFISYDFELYGNDFTEEVLKRVKNSSNSNIVTKKVNPSEREPNFLRDNWLYLTIGGVVVISGIAVYVLINKKRSSL